VDLGRYDVPVRAKRRFAVEHQEHAGRELPVEIRYFTSASLGGDYVGIANEDETKLTADRLRAGLQ